MADGDEAPSGDRKEPQKKNMMVILALVVVVIIIFVIVGVVASRKRDDDNNNNQFGNPNNPNFNPNFVNNCNALNNAFTTCLAGLNSGSFNTGFNNNFNTGNTGSFNNQQNMNMNQQAGDCSLCVNSFSSSSARSCQLFAADVCPAFQEDRNCLACGQCRAQAIQYLQCGVPGSSGGTCNLNCNIPGLGFGGSTGGIFPGMQPNIILILMSDLGFADLASYGHPYAETPNLDRFAREGTSFMNFHTTGDAPASSFPGWLTSRNPSWFPNYTADFGFLGTMTVMEMMKDAGYYVGHVGRWDIGPQPDEDNDRDQDNNNNRNRNRYDIDFLDYGSSNKNDDRGKEGNRFDAAMDFLDVAARRNRPFYLNLFTFANQQPVQPPDDLIREINNLNINENRFERSFQTEVIDEVEDRCGGDIDESMREYLAELYGVDELIGRFLDRLDSMGLSQNTLVVFSATNGPGRVRESCNNVGYTGPFRGRKHDFHEGGTRVPFIARWPGYIPAGMTNEFSVISALDWLPTVGGIAGANVPYGTVEGEDISDILAGNVRSRTNPLFWRTLQAQNEATMLYGRWKYYDDLRELYDLSTDLEERNNLYNRDTNVRNAMSETLDDWERSLPTVHRRGNQNRANFDPDEPVEFIQPPRGVSP